MSKAKAGSVRDQRTLLRRLQQDGYMIDHTGSGHLRVRPSPERRAHLMDQGFPVDEAPAQVILSCTTSDWRGIKNALKQLKTIGFES